MEWSRSQGGEIQGAQPTLYLKIFNNLYGCTRTKTYSEPHFINWATKYLPYFLSHFMETPDPLIFRITDIV